jgi:hydrogenase nickel incorporation protein HypB
MCAVCGCGSGEAKIEGAVKGEHFHVHADGTGHSHPGGHDRQHRYYLARHPAPAPDMQEARLVRLEQEILSKNDALAAANRRNFRERGILALNLVSSPGSGKTTLLVSTIKALRGRRPICVIEGDQQTTRDADLIRATGVPAIQINTGRGCHLDALMVNRALQQMHVPDGGLLFIENVGNLVCPAAFDLGEAHKVVILSVTEGEDKPLKYPNMFAAADLMLLNKIDLLPHLDFDASLAIGFARRVNPRIGAIYTAGRSEEGLREWLEWLDAHAELAASQNATAQTPAGQPIELEVNEWLRTGD